ncbi:3'-5' exonuclease family protein [Paraburkholderia tropica]|uniref:hypothetical protein n=1 Tax=Paraburkholderia tropica TaxID=92647 RepID=UPI0038B78447
MHRKLCRLDGLACDNGSKSRHPRYGRPQDILAEPLLAITSHPPGPVTTPPRIMTATGDENHAEPSWPNPRLSRSVDSNGAGLRYSSFIPHGSRYFIDTEFTDFSRCQLISLAIVGENGDEFYGERTDFDRSLCSDFVRTTVLPQLGQIDRRAMPFAQLREALRQWINGIPGQSGPVLCYDYETDLNLCRFLLGGPLPRGWRLENIAARRDLARRTSYLARHGGAHHALHDARANAYACGD